MILKDVTVEVRNHEEKRDAACLQAVFVSLCSSEHSSADIVAPSLHNVLMSV